MNASLIRLLMATVCLFLAGFAVLAGWGIWVGSTLLGDPGWRPWRGIGLILMNIATFLVLASFLVRSLRRLHTMLTRPRTPAHGLDLRDEAPRGNHA